MSEQQKLDRREIVSRGLLSHGVHFVVTDLVVRSKKGKLADGQNQERGGSLGLNWSAQNTGSIGFLVEWLSEKVREQGGTVRKHKLVGPFPDGQGHEVKLPMVRLLREQFLQTQTS